MQQTLESIEVIGVSSSKKFIFSGKKPSFERFSFRSILSNKLMAFGDIDIPAPPSLICDDRSKIIGLISFLNKKHPKESPAIPPPIMAIC